MKTTPTRFHQIDGRTLGIEWGDGARHSLVVREMRLLCPCAGCVSEVTGKRILDPAQVPDDVYPASIAPGGNYGIRIQWSDGHDTGIYTYEVLRRWGEEAEGVE